MNKLSKQEFDTLIKTFLVDRFFPDYIHIPGLGVRVTLKSYSQFSEDFYKAYYERGEQGIIIFLDSIKNNPAINLAFNRSKKIVYSHLDSIGLTDEKERQKYVSNIIDDVTAGKMPTIPKNGEGK